MAVLISYWERRDKAGIEPLAHAANHYCQAARAQEGIRSARFYWVDADHIAIMSEAESFEVFDRPTPELGEAAFALTDLARASGAERWYEPREAEEAYRRAGR